MKEATAPTVGQTKQLSNCLLTESMSDQSILMRTVLWVWRLFLLRNADDSAARQMGKSKRPRWYLVNIVFCLVLVGHSLVTPFIELQTAQASPARLAHQNAADTHLIPHRPHDVFSDIASALTTIADDIGKIWDVVQALFQHDFAGWVACVLTAGTVPCPNVSGAPWSFDCPIIGTTQALNDSSQPMYNSSGQAIMVNVIDGAADKTIYQLATEALSPNAQQDWLSGDANGGDTSASSLASEPGHLTTTYYADTFYRPGMSLLTSSSMLIAATMIGPLFALAGFQVLMCSLKPNAERAMANALDALGRVLLAAAIVGLAYLVIQRLIDLANTVNTAVIALHGEIPYSNNTTIDGAAISFGTDKSYRGIVVPMALWGCIMDDFISLMANRVANMLGSMVPVLGGLLGITGRVKEVLELVNDIGEFALLILSVTIWGQAVARIILINYYIILAPMAFACWGLPGQMGGQVLRAWFKGFLQLLFMQTVQIFILTTVPVIMPDFGKMQFPQGGSLIHGPLQTLFVQLPPIITAVAAVGAPKVMMGIGPMKTVAQAGSLAGKAIGAAMFAANSMIKK